MPLPKVLAIVLLAALPVLVAAAPEESDIASAEGDTSSTAGGVQFDIGDNLIGNPDNANPLSTATVGQLTYLSSGNDPVSIVINVINLSLSFLGLLSLIFVLYAGYIWFTARDNEEEVTKAKDILKGAVIGLAITLSAMGIAQLLFNSLATVTTVPATSWTIPFVSPAYAEEPAPTYKPEDLPFDPLLANQSTTALGGNVLGTIGTIDLGSADPLTVIISVTNIALTLLGMAFLVLLMYAGFLWVTARGNEEQLVKAKTIIKRSVIGLVIVLAAYSISWFTFYIISAYTYGETFLAT